MIKIREAVLDEVPAIVRVHVQADWDTFSALFGSQAYAPEPGDKRTPKAARDRRWRYPIGSERRHIDDSVVEHARLICRNGCASSVSISAGVIAVPRLRFLQEASLEKPSPCDAE